MRNTKKQDMHNNIQKHGEQLNAIFNTGIEPISLCKKLLRLERKAHHATTCLCNTNTLHLMELNHLTGYDVEQASEEEQDKFFDGIKNSLSKILGKENMKHVFINFDARGYALKIKTDYVNTLYLQGKRIYTDMGGYGILAPDFGGE